jgi:hypothetical protein
LRALVGATVTVETASAVVHGTLLSATRQSLWLVDGDADLVVPLPLVRSVAPDDD